MRRLSLAFSVFLVGALTGACGSSTQTVTAPSTVKCAVSASANPSSFSASGGGGTVAVSTNRECQWSASPSGTWIQLGSPAGGQGDGNVSFSVQANGDPVVRRGAISVGDQQVAIAQEAAPCIFNVAPLAQTVSPAGERRTLQVTASSAQCAWTARSDTEWLSIVGGAQGTGNGEVVYEARSTTGPTRVGTLVVAGQTVTITQGEGCSISISPLSQSVGASGGSGSISVSTAPGCGWTAQSNVSWISITSGQSGNGPGSVLFSVGAWDGPTRSGTIQVGGQQFTVTQTAGCSFTIDPASQSVPTGGGTGTVNVHSAAGCGWTASSNASWLTIASGGSGSGEGRVQFSAAPNTGPQRSGTLSVAGRSFTVTQAGCSFILSASSASFAAIGGSGSFSITAPGSCPWTATSSDTSWLHVTAGASGTGNGTVSFSADRNTGPARSATITADGQTFTVQQTAPCSYSLSPTSASFTADAGTTAVTVTADAGCPWSASAPTTDAWVQITSGASGTGPGSVQLRVDANSAGARSSTLTIADIAFVVSQAGCSYAIAPTSQNFDPAGGSGSFSMTAPGSCPWTARSSDTSWLQITGDATGTGNGTVSFTATANTGPARSATITAGLQTITAGLQTFTATQASCTITLLPSSQNFGASAERGSFSVNTSGGCTWTATTSDSWIHITAGSSGTGGGSVEFTVDANTEAKRTGSIVVNGERFTVSQDKG